MVVEWKDIQDLFSRHGSSLSLTDKLSLELGGTFSELLRGEDDSLDTSLHSGQLSLFEASVA